MELCEVYLCPAWLAVTDEVGYAARTPWPVLVTGPRGSGKSLLARRIHEESRRAGSFVESAAPTCSEGLLQSEIRGHARYAFTDARTDHRGVLEQAHGGTLFLDEIESASPSLQALLVSLVEQGEVVRVGEERPRKVDVRFIYASNADLDRLAASGRFRADLLDRMRVHLIRVPALGEYRDYLPVLADLFLERALGILRVDRRPGFSEEAIRRLVTYAWPGNLRELDAVTRHVAARIREPVVGLHHLPPYLVAAPATDPGGAANQALRTRVLRALQKHEGNKSAAARDLNLSRSAFGRLALRIERGTPGGGLPREA